MGIIPSDLFRRGKSTLTLRQVTDWLHQNDYGQIVASDQGKTLNAAGQDFRYEAESAKPGGFDTIPLAVRDGESHVLWGVELHLYGLITAGTQLTVTWTDGGANCILLSSKDTSFAAHTVYEGQLNGKRVNGIAAYRYNISGDYNESRGTVGGIVRLNLGIRLDFDREEVSLWDGDQIIYRAAIPGLDCFTVGHFEVRTAAESQDGAAFRVKQIGLRLDA